MAERIGGDALKGRLWTRLDGPHALPALCLGLLWVPSERLG